jgi:hypothetical protein
MSEVTRILSAIDRGNLEPVALQPSDDQLALDEALQKLAAAGPEGMSVRRFGLLDRSNERALDYSGRAGAVGSRPGVMRLF